MSYKKREAELERKFYKNRMDLIAIGSTAPINQQIIARLSALAWHLKQKYRAEGSSYYVSKRSYEADLSKITALAGKVAQGEAFESEALEAVKEAKEYLELIAGYRVRDNRKTRVY